MAVGSSPGSTNDVTDTSDDGNDSDGNTTDDATETAIDPLPLLEVTKTATVTDNGDGFTGTGDIIEYTITVENKGNVTVSSPTFNEYLRDGDGLNITSSLVGPTYTSKTLSPTVRELNVTVAAGVGGGLSLIHI